MSADVDEARAALLRLMPYAETHDLLAAFEAAVRAEGRDPYDSLTEHRQQERAGTHLQDTTDCYFCQRAESAETMAALREAVLDNIEAFPGSDLCRYCQNLLSDGHSFDCVVVKARALAATPAEEERTPYDDVGDPHEH